MFRAARKLPVMKTLLAIVLALMCQSTAHSECTSSGMWAFPFGSTIGRSAIFVVNGYANSQKVITGLNKEYNIYLQSGMSKVRLIVKGIYVGQHGLTQAVLHPESELRVGLEYTMHIDNLPDGEYLNRYNQSKHAYETVTYTVVATLDKESPQLHSRPKELAKHLMYLGCGPSTHVEFSNPASDKSEIIVKTTVKNLGSGKETTYYITPDSNKILVGRDMCSGAFDFDNSLEYEVEFSFMDAVGNVTPWSGERIRFTKPTKETR